MARAYAQPVGRAGDYTESEQQMTENFLERLETLKQIQQEQLEGLKQAREVQKSGGALPGTPQWEDQWNKVRANDTQGRVLNNVLNQLDDLSKPAFFNPPEGVTGVKKLPSGGFLGKDFTRETGIYQNEEARPASEAEPKGFLGGFSNVGSRPGPSKINTPEGEQRFEGLKAVSNAMTGKADGKIDRFRQTPDQKFLVDQYKTKAQEIKGLTDINDPDGARRSQLQSEMQDIEEQYKKEGAKLGPNAGGFPDVKKEAWPGEEPPVKPTAKQVPPYEASPGLKEGATATNKTTGQKIIFRNGGWGPVDAEETGGAASPLKKVSTPAMPDLSQYSRVVVDEKGTIWGEKNGQTVRIMTKPSDKIYNNRYANPDFTAYQQLLRSVQERKA